MYECRTQQEIVLIKDSDIFYNMPSGRPAMLTGVRLTNIDLLKLEVGTNQSNNVCSWRVVNMSSSTDDGSSWCVRIVSTKMLKVLFNFSYVHLYFSDEIYYKKSLNSPIFVIGPKKIGGKISCECPFKLQ